MNAISQSLLPKGAILNTENSDGLHREPESHESKHGADLISMSDNPYTKFSKKELILRDYLAADRTVLANERTFLAYIRTALTLFVVGISCIQFFDHPVIQVLGWIFIPSGIITLIIGIMRYRSVKSQIHEVSDRGGLTTPNR